MALPEEEIGEGQLRRRGLVVPQDFLHFFSMFQTEGQKLWEVRNFHSIRLPFTIYRDTVDRTPISKIKSFEDNISKSYSCRGSIIAFCIAMGYNIISDTGWWHL